MTDEQGPDEPGGRVPGREPAPPRRPADNGANDDSQLTATVEPRSLRLDPGGSGTVTIRVRNTGSVVDEIRLELLGEPARWGSVVPASLRLFPGTQGEAVVTFQPPRASRPRAGTIELRIGLTSQQRPAASVEHSLRLEVAPFDDMTTALDPRFGSTKAEFNSSIRVANRGNRPIEPLITASDPHNGLALTVQPDRLHIEPEAEAIARLTARPHRRIWLGHQRSYPFDVVVQARDVAPRTLDGRLDQLPLLPRWVPGLAIVALALVLAGGVACGAGIICEPGATATASPTGQITSTPATFTPSVTTSPTAAVTPSETATGSPDLTGCTLTVGRPFVRLRQEPRFDSLELGNVPESTYQALDTRLVDFAGGQDRWFMIQAEGRTGWIVDSQFEITDKSAQCP